MKKLIALLLAIPIIAALLPWSVCAISPIDTDRASSLTLHYRYNGEPFADLEIKTYRVAAIYADGTYALTGAFKDYPVNIYGITTAAEWRQVTTTLAAYAVADKLSPTETKPTDHNGTVVFDKITTGMYLTLAVRVEEQGRVTLFESFLTSVPNPDENGKMQYDVTAYPKCEQFEPTPEGIEYKIVKQWKDSGNTHARPDEVQVDILRNGELQSTQTLSAGNNWCYRWTAPEDGSQWQAVERQIADVYTVTIEENGTAILITNVYNVPEKPPQTGETAVLWPYVLAMCIAGGVIMVLAMGRRRGEE
ncbi:MAG: Cna B-type domain-containing protein [Clostridia bacterium]|nr:Cna B-type domain-containing protein [Clostridia bacterium]